MEQYVLSILLKSLVISAIILALSLLNALCGKAFPAKLRYAIWLVVLFGLIIPLPSAVSNGIITVPLPVQTKYAVVNNAGIELPPITTANIQDAAGSFSFGEFISPFMICTFVWGLISIMFFTWHIRRYICFLRTIRRWSVKVKDENLLSVFLAVQAEMGLQQKNIDLKVCGFVSSSMLTGFLRPMILLPEKYFGTDELELIFRHELIHYKRRDLLVKLLSVIAISLYWFNPIIYWMYEAIQADGEASCDEAVLLASGKENRHFYAEVIIGMIGEKNRIGTILSTCLFYRSKFSIKKRLDTIMDTTRKMKWPAILVLVIVLMLTLLSGSVFAFAIRERPVPILPFTMSELPLSVSGSMEIALSKVGGGMVEGIEFDRGNGSLIYVITVRHNNRQYEIMIDAATGEITGFKEEAALALTQAYNSARISFIRAMETAITRIGVDMVEDIELEYEGALIYVLKVRQDNQQHEIRINAMTGEVIQ
jgi:beta-lactamase regulating signal transducer with metallopeptidase domain/uncharacterized membrane protein YkoI